MIKKLISISDKKYEDQRGMILVGVIIITSALIVMGLSLSSFTSAQYRVTTENVFRANAILVAEAGVEQSLYELNQSDTFAGFNTEQEYFNDETQGRGVYTSVVAEIPETNAKTITATGKIYRYGTDDLVSTRIVEVTTVGTNSEGFSVHTGPGGLILSGSANITNSDVYVNGRIIMSGASKIGTHSQPLNVNVANMACPTGNNPGPTFPQVCTSGDPISLQWSTHIYGTVCATHQTSTGPNPSGNILPGNGGLGLIDDCVAAPVTPPSYDRQAHINNVVIEGSGNSNSYVCNSWPFDRVWPANLKLNGNVNIASSCSLVIRGDTYITGDLSLGGAARIYVDDSVGTDRPVVMVDGTITVGGSSQVIANSSGTGVHFISFKSSASCSPNCTSLSGNELKNSQNLQTVTVGGAGNMAGMIFHAYWGKVRLTGSGNVGSAVGQTVDLSGAGTITFGTTLSSGERTWTITSYQQKFPE